jgi:hypothetical protein
MSGRAGHRRAFLSGLLTLILAVPLLTPLASRLTPAASAAPASASARAVGLSGEARIDPASHEISATIAASFQLSEAARLLQLNLNPDLQLTRAVVGGAEATWRRDGWQTNLNLPQPAASGDIVCVTLTYRGQLVSTGWGTRAHIGPEGVFLAREAWLPSDTSWTYATPAVLNIDLPGDWTLVNQSPAETMATADAGRVRSRLVTADLNLVAGRYQRREIAVGGLRIALFTYTDYPEAGQALADELPSAVSFVRATLGDAPLTGLTIAHMPAVPGFGGGVTYPGLIGLVPDFRYARGYDARSVLPHELTHRWQQLRGGGISGPGQLWLSEATATYVGQMYLEERYGAAAFADALSQAAEVCRRDRLLDGGGSILDQEASDRPDLRYATVYLKGALAFDTLRRELGETEFRAFLRQHLDWPTEDRAAWINRCSRFAGRDLSGFFADWLERDALPAEPIGLTAVNGHLTVAVDPRSGVVSGHAELILANRLGARPSFRLSLNTGLTVSAVTVRGAAAPFVQSMRDLLITPSQSIAAGETFPVTITYSGVPIATGAVERGAPTDLPATLLWYPSLTDLTWSGPIELRLPAGWAARTPGWTQKRQANGAVALTTTDTESALLDLTAVPRATSPQLVTGAALAAVLCTVAVIVRARRRRS